MKSSTKLHLICVDLYFSQTSHLPFDIKCVRYCVVPIPNDKFDLTSDCSSRNIDSYCGIVALCDEQMAHDDSYTTSPVRRRLALPAGDI